LIFDFTPISIVIFIATFLNIIVAYAVWQRRKTKGGVYFSFATQSLALWTFAAALDYAAVPIPLKVFFAKAEAIGYMSAITLMTMASLSYAGHHDWLRRPWVKALLIFIPISNLLLVWTNELHSWIWSGFRLNPAAPNVLIFEHGRAFLWVTVSGYGLLLTMMTSLMQAAFTGAAPAQRQARQLLLALIIPILANLAYLSDLFNTPGVDWSSISFSITGLLFLLALYGSRFLDIAPVARNTMIERMDDGVLVLDTKGYLVDFNLAAQKTLFKKNLLQQRKNIFEQSLIKLCLL